MDKQQTPSNRGHRDRQIDNHHQTDRQTDRQPPLNRGQRDRERDR